MNVDKDMPNYGIFIYMRMKAHSQYYVNKRQRPCWGSCEEEGRDEANGYRGRYLANRMLLECILDKVAIVNFVWCR